MGIGHDEFVQIGKKLAPQSGRLSAGGGSSNRYLSNTQLRPNYFRRGFPNMQSVLASARRHLDIGGVMSALFS